MRLEGAVKSSTSLKQAWCARCDCEATLQRVLWDCLWWQKQTIPEHVKDLKARWDHEAVWCHGLIPRLRSPEAQEHTQLTGAWVDGGVISDPDVEYATDGSPGSSQDPDAGLFDGPPLPSN